MQNSKLVVGLDIGTTKICVIVGCRNEYGKVEILGMGKTDSFGVMRGVVSNIDKTVASIKAAVEIASKISNVEIKEVVVGIAGQHIKSMQHRGMLIRKNIDDEISQTDVDAIERDMHQLAMQPGEEIIQVIPQEYFIDQELGIPDPVGHCGIRLEANFHIITGLVTAIRNINKCVQKSGLAPSDLILEPIASSESVLIDEEKEAGVVLVDIGGGTTDIAIFKDRVIRHTAVIPFGGNIITQDIKEGCNIIFSQAESLKNKFGSALASQTKDNEIISIPGLRGRDPKEISVRNLANIIQARMQEIIEMVYAEIKHSGFEHKLSQGIVITGGGAELKNIRQLFELVTGFDTRIGYPNEHLAKGFDEVKKPMYATAVGLVLTGLHKVEKNTEVVEQIQPEVMIEAEAPPIIREPTKSGASWWQRMLQMGQEVLKDEEDAELK